MSRKFKSQASSARAASNFGGFGSFQTTASPLSYVSEQPDLSQIREPNLIVALKNLGKRDSTTKAKALDELLESLKDNTDLAVLTAWSDLYPRTSIDNSQIVRRNAHTLQGLLTINFGKKIAPLLSKFIPSWLAGTFDSDKSVAKAAQEALDRAFVTPEKKKALWNLYKDSIYGRVEDVLLVQTTTTLSDERTTSPDEAETKYVRVVGTGMRLFGQLLTYGLENHEMLQEKRLWDFLYHEDSYLRNSACGLLQIVLAKDIQGLDWTVLSTALLYKGLGKSQTGSSRAYAQCLCKATEVRPSVWTSDYTSKTAVSKRLLQYLRQGSQNGPQDVWSLLAQLLQVVPKEVWHQNSDDTHNLAEAYRIGVSSERIYVDAAWASYILVCEWLTKQIEAPEARDIFIERHLAPVVASYVNKSSDEKWRVGGRAERTASTALQAIRNQSRGALEKTWTSLIDSTIEKMRLSLPESSKEFRSSQDAVAAQGRRVLNLQSHAGVTSMTQALNLPLLQTALDLLRSRNGKPYGAASIVNDFAANDEIDDSDLKRFLESDLHKLVNSPSSIQLVSLALKFNVAVGSILLASTLQSPIIIEATEYFLRAAPRSQFEDEKVQNLVLEKIAKFDSEYTRVYAISILANPQLSEHNLRTEVFSKLISSLTAPATQSDALSMLETALSQPSLAQIIANSEYGPQITSKLLLLSDSSDSNMADRANALSTAMSSRGAAAASSIPIIRQQLRGEGDTLSVLTLTDLGLKNVTTVDAQELLPETVDWEKALKPHLSSSTSTSLAITSPLRGAVWSVEPNASDTEQKIVRDAEDFSLLFRITFFITKVFTPHPSIFRSLSGAPGHALHQFYPIAIQLINEKITSDAANDIWLGSTDEVLQAAADVLSEGSQLLESWQENENFTGFWLQMGHNIEGLSRRAYLTALAFRQISTALSERSPRVVIQEYEAEFSKIHRSDNLLQSATLLSAVAETMLATQAGLKLVNELIADITEKPAYLERLILLNTLLTADSAVLEKVPQQRLVFLFKSVVGHIKDLDLRPSVLSEAFVLISRVIPCVKDIYGEHWDTLIETLSSAWEFLAKDEITILHSSLLAYAQLKKILKSEDVNDDLREAWTSSKEELDRGLLQCLESLSAVSGEVDQPRTITAELLRRQLEGVLLPHGVDLFNLLASGLPAVRRAAYDILHKSVPTKQEQISIDVALDQRIAELPAELLHLIDDQTDTQRYLLSWKIVFDHYPKASHKLREIYTANLKASDVVGGLLEYLCERLRITSGRPLDASKLDIIAYNLGTSESYEHDVQWLSVHLYYLALSFIPSLAKDWFLQQKNRIKQPLESWTQKHVTPLIVSTSLATVTEWSSAQSQDPEDRPIEIKSSPRGSEIVASIPIDPESPPISLAISLPAAYPLESPTVTSRTRVGVSDKNWTSWLRTFQIIIFSSGSIIEGLVAFRRNVQGALKGQSECAICYSIIGTDMQTPNKKCGTCKNMFHGVCLFRWFKSSNSSSCPLCRNNFNYA